MKLSHCVANQMLEINQILKEMSTTDRKKLIDQSVRFLQHPTVRDTPLSEKLKFLEKKGLTSQVMFRT